MATTTADLKTKADKLVESVNNVPSTFLSNYIPPSLSNIVDKYLIQDYFEKLFRYLKQTKGIVLPKSNDEPGNARKAKEIDEQEAQTKQMQANTEIMIDEWTGLSELEILILMHNHLALHVNLNLYQSQSKLRQGAAYNKNKPQYLDAIKYSLLTASPFSIELIQKLLISPKVLKQKRDKDEAGKTKKLLIPQQALQQSLDKDGNTLLHLAAFMNRDVLAYILGQSKKYSEANINTANNQGKTPLHLATELGVIEQVNLILQFSPSLSLKDKEGQDVFSIAQRRQDPQIISSLQYKRTTLTEELVKEVFQAKCDIEKIAKLVELGADLTYSNPKISSHPGRSLFHIICREKALAIIQCCLEQDPTLITLRDGSGYLPITYATENPDKGTLRLILSQSLNEQNGICQDPQVQAFVTPASDTQNVRIVMLLPPPPIKISSPSILNEVTLSAVESPYSEKYISEGIYVTSSSESNSSSSSQRSSGETASIAINDLSIEDDMHHPFSLPPSSTPMPAIQNPVFIGHSTSFKLQQDHSDSGQSKFNWEQATQGTQETQGTQGTQGTWGFTQEKEIVGGLPLGGLPPPLFPQYFHVATDLSLPLPLPLFPQHHYEENVDKVIETFIQRPLIVFSFQEAVNQKGQKETLELLATRHAIQKTQEEEISSDDESDRNGLSTMEQQRLLADLNSGSSPPSPTG